MDSREFRSEGVGPQPKDWHSSARMGMTEPLGCRGAHAWLPALLGHGAAWHRDAPAPHLLASRDDLGLGQCQGSPTLSSPARCPCSLLAPAAPGEHQFGSRRAAGAPGSKTAAPALGMQRSRWRDAESGADTGATPFLGKRGLTIEECHICQACLCFQVPMSHPSGPQGGGRAERARSQRS